jgi:hypothetical protein
MQSNGSQCGSKAPQKFETLTDILESNVVKKSKIPVKHVE